MKRDSNDIKSLVGNILTYVSKSQDSPLDTDFVKVVVPTLVNGTMQKNVVVKSASEWALVALLHLREGTEFYQVFITPRDLPVSVWVISSLHFQHTTSVNTTATGISKVPRVLKFGNLKSP